MTPILLAIFLASPAAAYEWASPEEVAKRVGLSEESVERVKNGEVAAEELEPTSDKDLSLVVAMRLDAPIATVYEFVRADRLAEFQTLTVSHGLIDPAAPSLADMTLPAETLERLAKDPGGTFSMSEAEAGLIAEAGKEGGDAALAAYRGVLEARAVAYWENGLAGIEPYAGEGRSPKLDLAHANEAARKLVQHPDFLAELDAAPAKSPGRAQHVLSWSVQKGRDQAAPVLNHQILFKEDGGELFLQRRFYSAYDYDSLQILTGVLPASSPDQSVVFYTNHTYTPQVTGFGGSAKRSIGRKLLREELVAEMERAQKAIPGK